MSIKLVDTLVSMGNFPVANADGIQFSDGESLQKKLDDGTLGGGAEAYMEMSQAEYDALTEEEKSNGTEYRTYDTGRIYKYGVLYGGKEPVETTWEDYKTLEADGLVDPTTDYIVTANENGILLGATDVAYDDTKTVKGKFDEVDTSIEELNNKVDTNTPKSNYIDNSDFSVNTRGQAEYVSDGSVMYTVDRWYIDGGKLSQVENGILLTNTNESNLIRLKQDIRIGFNYFAGKTLTLSAKIDGQILTKSATLPTEKPTGSSIQYIAVGIPAFGLNLNYVPTQDYFVPYIALAYQRNVVVEWVKLEINDALSTYIQPDYQSEKIKTSLMTNNGTLTLPASIDDSSTVLLKTWSSSKIASELKTSSNTEPITIAFPNIVKQTSYGNASQYQIRNGICYVTMDIMPNGDSENTVVCELPMPTMMTNISVVPFALEQYNQNGMLILSTNGVVKAYGLEKNIRYAVSFSYPIAE